MDVVGAFLESCRLRSSTPMVTSPATFYTRWVLGQVTHRMCRSLGFDPLSIGSLWNSDGERVLSISPWEAKQFSYGSSWAWYVLPYLHGRWWEKSIEIRSANSIEAGLLGIIGCVLGVLGMLMDVDGCYTKIYSRNVDVAPRGMVHQKCRLWYRLPAGACVDSSKVWPRGRYPSGGRWQSSRVLCYESAWNESDVTYIFSQIIAYKLNIIYDWFYLYQSLVNSSSSVASPR